MKACDPGLSKCYCGFADPSFRNKCFNLIVLPITEPSIVALSQTGSGVSKERFFALAL